MCTVYLDQVAKPFPMADGAEAAGKQSVSMDKENLQAMIQNTKEQLNSLFHGPGADYVVFTEGIGEAFDKTLRSILKKGDHVLVSPMESDAVMIYSRIWKGMWSTACFHVMKRVSSFCLMMKKVKKVLRQLSD